MCTTSVVLGTSGNSLNHSSLFHDAFSETETMYEYVILLGHNAVYTDVSEVSNTSIIRAMNIHHTSEMSIYFN